MSLIRPSATDHNVLMTTLFENPWIILIVGGMMLAMLVGGLIQTGARAILWAIAATALLTIIMVFVERSVVTPREEIGALLREIAGSWKATTTKPSWIHC